MSIIGIDLGTTYSCVGIWKQASQSVEIIPNHLGHRTTPSWVAFEPNSSTRTIGLPARRMSSNNPKNTVFDVKRLMGRKFSEIEGDLDNYPYKIVPDTRGFPLIQVTYNGQERSYKPEEISAMILTYLKETAETYLNEPVTKAVITVPAYFSDYQRQATKDAATIAGIECVRIINEPTAACLCYGLNKRNDDSYIMVVDCGGGTHDCSILNLDGGVFQVLSTCGDSHLGGEDIDWLLTEYVAKQSRTMVDLTQDPKRLKRLQLACEQAKRELSAQNETEIMLESFHPDGTDLRVTLTRAIFENLIAPILDRVMKPVIQCLKDSQMERESINEIVMVGGSTRIPILRARISEYFNNKQLNTSVNPDEAIAYGAAVQGALLSEKVHESLKDLVLLDVTPLSLGIETSGGIMAKIIERNTNIPCNQSKMFSTAEDNQASVLIQVFEGERKFTKDCQKLGVFELGPLPESPRGVPKIQVTFSIDSNGILQISALDKNTGLGTEAKLTPESGRLSGPEIQEMIREAEQYKIQDDIRQSCIEEYTQFERYLFSVQQATNDALLNESLTEEERSFTNQYLINSFQWINDNRNDTSTTMESIRQARLSVEYNLKPLMAKLYSH